MSIATNTPLFIGGQTCILVRDVLGNMPTDKYTSQDQGDLKVWYEEAALRETRENNPNTLVFGFWQTLISSGLIDTSIKLQIVYTNEKQDFGYYLYSNTNLLHTGTIFDGELQTLPGIAIADGITISDGVSIDARLDILKLPEHPLRTHRERLLAASARKKSSQQRTFLAFVLVAGAGLLADTGLAYHHEMHMDEFAKTNSRLHIAEQNLKDLSRRKLLYQPNQQITLSNLYQVVTLLPDSQVSGEISLLPYKDVAIDVISKRDPTVGLSQLSDKGLSVARHTSSKTAIGWVNNEGR